MKYGVCKLVLLGSPLGHPKGVPCAELSPQVTEGLPATATNRFHKELRFFFSLLKRKKEAKKEKSSRCTCTVRQMHHPKIIQRIFRLCKIFYIYVETPPPPNGGPPPLSGEAFLPCEFPSTKLPRRGIQAAAAAVTLPFLQLKLGRRVSGDPPLSLLKRKKEAKKEKSSRCTCTTWQRTTRRLHINKTPPAGHTGCCCRRNITLFTVEIGA